MSEETTAIAKTPMMTGEHGLVLRDLDQMWRFSTAVVKSGLAPSSFKTAEAVMIAIQYGAEVGLSPMQSLQSLAVINGKPSLYGDALPALAWSSGLLESLDESIAGEGDGRIANCSVRRKGVRNPISRSFSVMDAKRAGLWGKSGPWSSYPDRMLSMRARAFAFRDGFADVLRGLHVSEEVADYEPRLATQSDQTTGYVLPTGEPQTQQPDDSVATADQNVSVWKAQIGFTKTIGDLDQLAKEYRDDSPSLTPYEREKIDELFVARTEELKQPKGE